MKTTLTLLLALTAVAVGTHAVEFHVAINGNDSNVGTKKAPFRTIRHAADVAQPGDVVTVHAGVYRERVTPPRGGESDAKRIVYRSAGDGKTTITGSEIMKGWSNVQSNVWKVIIPNSFFGSFNPYSDLIHGDWFGTNGREHHTGAVYLNGDWLVEAASLDALLKPGYHEKKSGEYLLNIAWIRPANSTGRIAADHFADKHGMNTAPCSEGGKCLGWIEDGNWVRYDGVDFGNQSGMVEIRAASVTGGGTIELRDSSAKGKLLGKVRVADTGDWQSWALFKAKIKPISGTKNLCLVFKCNETEPSPLWFGQADKENTTIWAQFKDVNPNEANVEINARQTVFTPAQAGVNFITVRGFDLRNAAPPWAPPTAAQIGIVSAYWCKGWIIENNEISYSKCSGVALGKYGDEWDNRAESAEGYVGTLTRALTNGWNKATVGSHIVRNNHIHHCDQTGVVGSLGCSFSTVAGNVIHDIHTHRRFGGAEMAGIKFHGAIDVTISHNHIYRCGDVSGIWLDWMGQGARVTGNLMHDNTGAFGDIFLEMQHGPLLVDNNLFLSPQKSFVFNAQGMAVVHNLIVGSIGNLVGDARETPFHGRHTTELAGMYAAPKGDSGDHRFYNNLVVAPCKLAALDNSVLPCFAVGNVFTRGTQPSKFDTSALLRPDCDPQIKLVQKSDGWYLRLTEDKSWRAAQKRSLVSTELLAKAKVPDLLYENPDGTPLRVDTGYFGKHRDLKNPMPGPFENPGRGPKTFKVW